MYGTTMNINKINFAKQAVYVLAIPLWWVCLWVYINTTYDCRIGIVGLSGMSCTQGSITTLVSFVLFGMPVAALALLYSLVAFILSVTLPYEHNDDDDRRPNKWFSIAKHLTLWVMPMGIALSASAPKSKAPAEMVREQKIADAISGAWLCQSQCNAAFPAGDFFSISRHLNGALQLVGTSGGQLRSVGDIWPSRSIENGFTIEVSNTSPPTVYSAKFEGATNMLSIENGKVLVRAPDAKPVKK
jgi:hypothetical protein